MYKLSPYSRIIEKSIAYLLLFLAVCMLFVLIWGLNKGFDFSDEGFALLGITHPADMHPGGLYQWPFYYLFHWFHPGLIFYRSLRILLLLISVGFLFNSLCHYFESIYLPLNNLHKIMLLSLLCIGISISYSIYAGMLSYNSITLIIGILISSIYIELQIRKAKTPFINLVVLASILCTYEFFCRFPTAIPLLILNIFFICISPQKIILKLWALLLFFGSTSLFLIAYIEFFYTGTLFQYYNDYNQIIALMEHHNASKLIEMYRNSFNYTYEHAIVYHYKLFFGLLFGSIIARIFEEKSYIKYSILGIQFLLLIKYASIIIEQKQYISGIIYNYVALEPYIFLGLSFISINIFYLSLSIKKVIQITILVLFFWGITFISVIGTNNELPLQCLQYLIFWFVIVFIFFRLNAANKYVRYVNTLFIIFIVILCFSQSYTGFVQHPYRITSSLNNAKITFKNKHLTHIYTDSTMQTSLEHVEKIITQSNHSKEPLQFIDFCKVPGMIYALDGYTPRNAWMSAGTPQLNTYIFNSTKELFAPDYILLPSISPNQKEIDAYFSNINIDLSTQYVFLDSVQHPLFHYKPMPTAYQIMIYKRL